MAVELTEIRRAREVAAYSSKPRTVSVVSVRYIAGAGDVVHEEVHENEDLLRSSVRHTNYLGGFGWRLVDTKSPQHAPFHGNEVSDGVDRTKLRMTVTLEKVE